MMNELEIKTVTEILKQLEPKPTISKPDCSSRVVRFINDVERIYSVWIVENELYIYFISISNVKQPYRYIHSILLSDPQLIQKLQDITHE